MVALLADIPRFAPPAPVRPVRPARQVAPIRPSRLIRPSRPIRPSQAVLRRRRLVATGLLMLVAVFSWIGLQAALGRIGGGPLATTGAPGGFQPAAARVWVVHPGDTLWSIALAVDPRGDVRPLVDRMAAQVHGQALYPGEAISIPAS